MSFTLSIAIPPAAIGLFTTRDQLALKQILREAELKSISLDVPAGRLVATASTQAALDTANGLAADRIARSGEIERVKTGRLEQRRVGISVHAVGLVLGRLGATIRRLRDEHGLERVEVHEGLRPGFSAEDAVDEHRKHVLLVGSRAAIDSACVDLDRLLRTVRPVDVLHGHLVRLAVPDHASKADVGRLAEWLRLNVPGVKSAGVGWSRDLGRPELWIRGQKCVRSTLLQSMRASSHCCTRYGLQLCLSLN